MSNFAMFDLETRSMTNRSSAAAAVRPPNRSPISAPVSRLQLIQAQFQRKLLLEKEEKMMQLYQEDGGNKQQVSRGGGGGAVRKYFADRRAQNGSYNGNGGVDPLSTSGGIISLQSSMNGGFRRNGPKQGSPIGWDKSYPLSPLDRDSSGSSSGYDSGNSFGSNFGASPHKNDNNNNNNSKNRGGGGTTVSNGQQRPSVRRNLAPPAVSKPARRAPSLDRRPRNNVASRANLNGMRRSNSQILSNDSQNAREERGDDDGFVPFSRIRKSPQNKPEVPKVPQAARNSRPRNTQSLTKASPSKNNTYKVQSPHREGQFDPESLDASPRGRKPLVPAIGYVPPVKPPQVSSKKSHPVRSVGRPSSSVDPNLVECEICNRHFAKDRIEKHMVICEKTNTNSKKRKVFDSTKMRMKETELEDYVRQTGKGGRKTVEQPMPAKKSDWRQKRNNFIESLRQAKVVQRHLAAGGKASDLPPPPPMDTSDYITCPHCNRKFSEGAADRHIPKCKNIKSNKNGDVHRR